MDLATVQIVGYLFNKKYMGWAILTEFIHRKPYALQFHPDLGLKAFRNKSLFKVYRKGDI